MARVRNPVAYINRLQDLETAIFEGSTAKIYFPSTERGYGNTNQNPLVADYPRFHATKGMEACISDVEALAIIGRKDRGIQNSIGAILESRNVLAKAVANIFRYCYFHCSRSLNSKASSH